MRKSSLLCVLTLTVLSMGAMSWGQAAPGAAPAGQPPSPMAGPGQSAPAPKLTEVGEDDIVLTIQGVCPDTPSAKPEDCKTTLTKKQFEKIASGLSPNVTPQLKRQLSTALPKFMAMSEAAKKKGLDKTEAYEQTLKIAEMQILTTQLQRSVQDEADKVSDADIEDYYKKNPEAFEQFSVDRLFIPKNKQAEPEKAQDDDKMTDEQKKAHEAAEKTKQEKGEQEMTKLAETLRARAAKGEDFIKLQKEAYEAAGMKMENPTINLPKVRRTGLPPAHSSVFDLKEGDVSQVITDNGGHYIYKVVSKTELPLAQVKEEVHNTLKTQRLKDMMDGYTNSYKVETNENYFGAAPPIGRPGPPHGRMPMAPGGAPGAPPTKPN